METLTMELMGAGMVAIAVVSFLPLWVVTTRDLNRRERLRRTPKGDTLSEDNQTRERENG